MAKDKYILNVKVASYTFPILRIQCNEKLIISNQQLVITSFVEKRAVSILIK